MSRVLISGDKDSEVQNKKNYKRSVREVVHAGIETFAMSAPETLRDARFLTHLSIGTRRVMRAAGEVAALSNRYKMKHCC